MSYLHDDGTLIFGEWARERVLPAFTTLHVDHGHRPEPMYGTKATGTGLVSNGYLGVDEIHVPAGQGFAPHTHPGDHLLIVVAGEGTVTFDGRIYPTRAGQVYMVEGDAPHAVGAITDHVILAVGAPHRPIGGADRMQLTEYEAIAATLGELHCLVCDRKGDPARLRLEGCEHAPVAAPDGRPLVVGLAPASPEHVTLQAFDRTRSGARLAALIGVPPEELVETVDTVNLSGDYLDDWQKVPKREWRNLAESRISARGRVVVCCGATVAEALGADASWAGWGGATAVGAGEEAFLAVVIPHPSGLSRAWNEQGVTERCRYAFRIARTLARCGPADGVAWAERDAAAFNVAMSTAPTVRSTT